MSDITYISIDSDFLSIFPHKISISDTSYSPYVADLRGINTPDTEPILLKLLQVQKIPISIDTSNIEIFNTTTTKLDQYDSYFAKPSFKLKLTVKRGQEDKPVDSKKKQKK